MERIRCTHPPSGGGVTQAVERLLMVVHRAHRFEGDAFAELVGRHAPVVVRRLVVAFFTFPNTG